MEQKRVRLLDARGVVRGNDEWDVAPLADRPAPLAEEADGDQPPRTRRLRRADQVDAVAAGGHGNEDVTCVPQGLDLAGEDLVEGEVIAGAGEHGRVAERDRGERPAVFPVADDQL